MNSFNDTTPERYCSVSESEKSFQSPSSSDDGFTSSKTDQGDSKIGQKEFGRKSSSLAHRIHEHVKLGPKFSETVKSKLSLGAKIIQEGGRENVFKQIFGMNEGEEMLKASQCYLYTTDGPIAGLLFISTEKVAFCSERSMTFSSPTGDQSVKTPYKVLIPIGKIKAVQESQNENKPAEKYIEIVTEDDFEFWFMGFLRYEKAFRNLQKAMSMANSH
ncbi:GEM-like protein 4 [Quillaja saponaria]|uniref:GEM-like protein 4 n=1 Tax=Quillaja saponaria TaxID=32244 RepID=A0AAD7Q5Q5_QUISA|nr:GEM-like protein 4 [Quillaja saponaria]